MSGPRICVVAKTWKREWLLPAFVACVECSMAHAGLEYDILICGSTRASQTAANELGVSYHHAENRPLTGKQDALFGRARDWAPDWVLLLGDDDLISAQFMQRMRPWLKDFHMVGWEDLYIHTPERTYYWPGYVASGVNRDETIGAGRLISARVLDAIDWAPCRGEEGDRALDRHMMQRIRKHAPWMREKRLRLREEAVALMDVKTKHSITGVAGFRGLETGSKVEREVAELVGMLPG